MGEGELDFFELDKNALDEEWVAQPRLYHRYAQLLADARRDHKQSEAELELVEAELKLEVRNKPGKFGLEKVTEDAVKSTVLLQSRYKSALAGEIRAKYDLDVAQAAVGVLDHRKAALENLVRLRLADYFSPPVAPGEARERMREVEADGAFGKGKRRDQ